MLAATQIIFGQRSRLFDHDFMLNINMRECVFCQINMIKYKLVENKNGGVLCLA